MRKQHVKKQLKRLGMLAFALVFLLFLDIDLRGQGGGAGSLQYGGRLGITSSTLTNSHNNILYSENKLGMALGGFVSYQATDFFGASVELLYAQEGASHIFPEYIYYSSQILVYESFLYANDIRRLNSNVTLHNIELPIILNFYVPGYTGDVEPRFYLGGSFDIIARAIAKDQVQDMTVPAVLSKRSKENVTSSFEYNNFGFLVGTGLNFTGGDLTMTLDIRYKIGLRNISNLATLNYESSSYYATNGFSNNCLMVLVGVALP